MIEEVSERGNYAQTFPISGCIGARVLTPSDSVLGKVVSVQVDSALSKVEGIVVKSGFSKIYIGREYISRLTNSAIFLKVEPAMLWKGKRVVTNDGDSVGRIKEIVRLRTTNSVDHFVVSSWFRKPFNIKPSQVETYGKALVLKEGVDVPRKSLW